MRWYRACALCYLIASALARDGRSDDPEVIAPPSFQVPGVPYVKQGDLEGAYLDLDEYRLVEASPAASVPLEPWSWQVLPNGLVYAPYLADTKASRFAARFVSVKEDGWLFDAVLGTQVGLLRYGTLSTMFPEGLQIDAEGSAQLRLDMPGELDVRSVDYRAGLPVTYGVGPRRWKLAYYHISSHLGDEFLLSHPTFPRLNYVRDSILIGYARYLTPQLRTYVEVGWAFHVDCGQPWEIQFGVDYAPLGPTGFGGAPFFALNGHLREELDYSGSITFQAGWAWRSDVNTSLLRIGMQYYNGLSNQYSFFREHEQQVGLAVWYDY